MRPRPITELACHERANDSGVDALAQFGVADRDADHIVGAAAQQPPTMHAVAFAGEDEDLRAGTLVELGEVIQDRDRVSAKVRNDRRDIVVGLQRGVRLGQVGGGADLVAVRREIVGDEGTRQAVVMRDKDTRASGLEVLLDTGVGLRFKVGAPRRPMAARASCG